MSPLSTDDYLFLNQLAIIDQVNTLKAEVDALRPLSKDQEGRIMQKLRLDWNYNSNAIEGNHLDYGETTALLMYGVTAKGKTLKDHMDIKGHNEAINFLEDFIKNQEELSEKDIRSLHEMLLVEPYESKSETEQGIIVNRRIHLGQYKTMPNHVKTVTGETHFYASPEDTPFLMRDLVEWYRSVISSKSLHPVVIAAIFHHRFTAIHPFDDGNGRMSRLLMNLILMKYGFPPAVIKNENKNEYYLALSQADTGFFGPFIELIASSVIDSLNIYLRGARGESIDEPLDLDKKLLLFKKELEARQDRVEVRRTTESKLSILENLLPTLLTKLSLTAAKFKEFFIEYVEYTMSFERPFGSSLGKRWIYNKSPFANRLEEIKSLAENEIIFLCARFNQFKLETNPFSVEVKLLISFSEFQYYIFSTVSKANELKDVTTLGYNQWLEGSDFKKYYHQQLTPEEINNLVYTIGDDLYETIHTLYNDPSALDIKINIFLLDSYWNEYIDYEFPLHNPTEREELNTTSSSVEDNIVHITLSELGYNFIANEKEITTAQDEFSKFLVDKKYVANRPIVIIH